MAGGSHSDDRSSLSLGQRWERLSTGVKMFLILTLGLAPLGIIAVAASIENAQEARLQSETEARAQLAITVQRITLPIARHALTIRAARDAIGDAQYSDENCRRTLARLARLPIAEARYALFGSAGRPRCVSPGYAVPAAPSSAGEATRVEIAPNGEWLRFALYAPDGALEGLVEFERDALAEVIAGGRGDFGVDLIQPGRRMILREGRRRGVLDEQIVVAQALLDGQYQMRVHSAVAPVTVASALSILTPLLMWLWASVIGWLLVQRLLLRPLARLQGAVAAYQPGDKSLNMPPALSPALEIEALGNAFSSMTQIVARHEADLEAGIARQTRLVREVHHRVKNNLQVVASLLNIHSRGATEAAAAAAYASIQRRVDALAVVHRNHYAELEDNRGVALRPLISELAANLRATAPTQAKAMQIRLDIEPAHATQDVAVSIAFLVTEIVEFGMLCGATTASIAVERIAPATARLTIEADSLSGACEQSLVDRFERVISGLARQLRAALERDPERGLYAVDFAVVAEDPA